MPDSRGPEHVYLRHGADLLVLDPQHGGAIREYTSGGRDVLRPTPLGAQDPLAFACFPLVPYANRIVHGRFTGGGRSVRLRPNWEGDPHPLHGQGWRRRWEVMEESASEATLQLVGGGDEWPWRYCGRQHFRIEPLGLHIRLSVENLSAEPMPAMLGLHPYFPDAARARLTARAPRVWMADSGALPVTEVATPEEWCFEDGRAVSECTLDNCFVGWDGIAVLAWPDRTAVLRASGCRYLHVYVPPAGDFFCLEPQTAATGALNRDDEQPELVRPGERLEMDVSLTLGAT
jgi:aldose 1-epimerase